jgi:hypothetical protein
MFLTPTRRHRSVNARKARTNLPRQLRLLNFKPANLNLTYQLELLKLKQTDLKLIASSLMSRGSPRSRLLKMRRQKRALT